MEPRTRALTVTLKALRLTLQWDESEQSDDMLIEALDALARFLMTQTEAAGINFLSEDAEIVSIESVVLDRLTQVEACLWDAGKEMKKKGEVRLVLDALGGVQHNGLRSSFSTLDLDNPPQSPAPPAVPKVSAQELSKCKSPAKAWVAVAGKVYDVSQYHAVHPGGSKVLLSACGKDSTDAFSSSHADKAHSWVSIGSVSNVSCLGELAK